MADVEKKEVVFHWRCSVPGCNAKGEDGVPFYKHPKTKKIFCSEHAGRLVGTQEPLKSGIVIGASDDESGDQVGGYDMDEVLYRRKDLW